MEKAHAKEFSEFLLIHNKYISNPKEHQKEFNEKGQVIINIIRTWEKKLCARSESGQYSKFSPNLSDKFWTEVKSHFPRIDFVGCKIQ